MRKGPTEADGTAHTQPVRPQGVSARAILIGLAATPLNAYWLTYIYWHFGYLIDRPSLIYYNCIVYLVALVGMNALVRRWRPKWSASATS